MTSLTLASPQRFTTGRRLLRRVAIVAAVLLLAWLALGILLINPLLNTLAPRFYQQQTGGQLVFDDLFFNPLDLSLRARNIADRRAEGESIWAVRHLRIDLAATSLFRRALLLEEVTVEGIRLHLRQLSPQRWNYEELLGAGPAGSAAEPEPTPPPAAEDEGSLPWVEVDRLLVTVDQALVAAPYLEQPLATTVRNTALAARQLTTASGAASRHHLSWTTLGAGEIGLASQRLEIRLGRDDPLITHIDGFALFLDHLALAGADGQPFALALTDAGGGQLYWQGRFALDDKQATGELALQDISLDPLWHLVRKETGLTLASGPTEARLRYLIDWNDALRYRLDEGSLTLREVSLTTPDAETGASLRQLAVTGIALDSVTRQVAVEQVALDQPSLRGWNQDSDVSLLKLVPDSAADEDPAPGEPWQIALRGLRLDGGRVDWRASQLAEPLQARDLHVQVANFAWPATAPAQVDLRVQLNGAQVAVAGEVQPTALDAALAGRIEGLPLTLINPTLATLLPFRIDQGSLDTQWTATVASGELTTATSDGALADVEVQRTDRDQRLVAWQRLSWQGVAVDLTEATIGVNGVTLAKPWFRFEINDDGTTNLSDLQPAASTSATAETASPSAGASESPATADEAPAGAAPAWTFGLETLKVEDGTLIFADRSLPRPFRARIQSFTGHVAGLTSDAEKSAEVDLRGNLADYAPVTLAGTAAPLAEPPRLQLGLTFSDVDLALLSPYSRTYAGYAIDGGLITIELAYRLEQERIRGSNRVVVRQLRLGEQVESPKAVDLPIRLALALLTDRQGVIDLNVDVTGDLSDPKFGLGKVIRGAFFNAISRVVTAPFRFLANLAGAGGDSAEELNYFDFEAGRTELVPGQAEKVATIQRALQERPTLRLHVVGHSDPARDEAALQRMLVDEALLEAGLSPEALAARNGAWERAVANLYDERLPEAGDDLDTEGQLAALQTAVEVPRGRLESLALRRAQSLKQELITGATPLPPGQVFIDGNTTRRDSVAEPRATLRLEG